MQRLPERMRVPGGARARLEAHPGRAQRAGSGAWMIGSCQTVPVKLGAHLARGPRSAAMMSMLSS